MSESVRNEKDNIRRLVLIVDDEQINRRLLGRIIEGEYDVIYAEDGEQALDLIRERQKTLSIILLDLIMPKIDGYELLNIIRDDHELSRIPVIVLTSERTAEVKSLQLGAADFIPKPYDMPEVILARVRRSIELAEDNIMISATETDTLSGLYTKKYFFQHCRRYDRYYPDVPMDAVAFNINRFHLINELNGRSYGDTVIAAVAAQLRRIISESEGIACRCDSDVFLMYIKHCDDYDSILNSITSGLNSAVGNSRIHLRMGVYRNCDKSADVEERFDRANFACNSLRVSYSTSFTIYDDTMRKRAIYAEKLIGDMDAGVANRQFKVYYQPKYNITGDEPVLSSAEALIRWDHPEYGFVHPASFIPLFEKNGLVHKLDQYVWKEVAVQMREWRDKFGITIPVSVNVSRLDIYDPELESMLLGLVKENGLEPYDYILEITESAYTDNSAQMTETVNKLREDGFRIEMDDFGSGYSSLNMLGSLYIDAMKLDMLFIQKMCEDAKGMKMIQLMIDIARFLNIPVVAEGVETQEQYDLLKKAGCDVIQGYYFSKPVPPEEFEKFIEAMIKQH